MSSTKLKIDLQNGILEMEGEEAFVKEIYRDFKDKVSSSSYGISQPVLKPTAILDPIKLTSNDKRATKTKKTGSVTKESYSLVKDLDLSGKVGGKSLRDFYNEKLPASALERNAVFAYYLERILHTSPITLNHIYTCYKEIPGLSVPSALRQSIFDTSFRKGWIDTKDMENITVPIKGENFVEQELPRKITTK